MRIKAFHIIFICLFFPFVTKAQTNEGILDKIITLGTKSITVQDIVYEMTKQQNIYFSYEPKEMPLQEKIEFLQNELTVKDILDVLLKNAGLTYKIQFNIIVLTRKTLLASEENKKIGLCSVHGKVTEKSTGNAISFVSIYMPGLSKGALSDSSGKYRITNINAGSYEIKFRFIGYKEVTKYVHITSSNEINVSLEGAFMELEPVTVTPGVFNIAKTEPNMNTLSSKEILLAPNFSKDINRTLRAIPGFANNDISAKPRVRGGHWNETATFIDNFEIYEPYHFEEMDGLASIFNADYAQDIKLLTGGYPAKYTDKMSGIIEVKTPDYVTQNQLSASIDFLNATLYGKTRINEKWNFLYGIRRGYLDLIMKGADANTDISPVYYDIWFKANYQVNKSNLLSVNFLKAKNDFNLKGKGDLNGNFYFHNIKNNNYVWINWKWHPNNNYYSLTTLGYQNLSAKSNNYFTQSLDSSNIDNKLGKILVLTQSHIWNISPNHCMEFGFELKKFQEQYLFKENRYDLFQSTPTNVIIDTIYVDARIKGYTFATYVQDTWAITKKFSFLPGIRVSRQSYSDHWYVAPRLAFKYNIIENLNLKGAYGIYYQPDNFEKLKSSEGQSTPLPKNNECIHYMVSLDYRLGQTIFKLDGYLKDYQYLSDDFRFDVYNRMFFSADENFNTQSSKSKGIEFTIRHKYGNDNVISMTYAWAKSTIKNELNQETYRNFDRRNTIILNYIQNLGRNWTMSFLSLFYTGEPYTPCDISFIGKTNDDKNMFFYKTQMKNSGRLPNFFNVDMKFEKTWYFKKAQMNIYLNIINLFDRQNITGYSWYSWQNYEGKWFVTTQRQSQNIPRFVSPGVSISF